MSEIARKAGVSDYIVEHFSKPVLVLGCGNVLFGDDGFGSAVARVLRERTDLPEELCVIEAGTGAKEILFDVILSEKKPGKIIIVDAMDKGLEPGELFRPATESVPLRKRDDFSMHEVPGSNLLAELRDLCGVEVEVIACQVKDIPETVRPGLSRPVEEAVTRAAEMIIGEWRSVKMKAAAERAEGS